MTFKAFQTVLAHRKCRGGDNVPHILFLHKPSDYTPCLHCQEERKESKTILRDQNVRLVGTMESFQHVCTEIFIRCITAKG